MSKLSGETSQFPFVRRAALGLGGFAAAVTFAAGCEGVKPADPNQGKTRDEITKCLPQGTQMPKMVTSGQTVSDYVVTIEHGGQQGDPCYSEAVKAVEIADQHAHDKRGIVSSFLTPRDVLIGLPVAEIAQH